MRLRRICAKESLGSLNASRALLFRVNHKHAIPMLRSIDGFALLIDRAALLTAGLLLPFSTIDQSMAAPDLRRSSLRDLQTALRDVRYQRRAVIDNKTLICASPFTAQLVGLFYSECHCHRSVDCCAIGRR